MKTRAQEDLVLAERLVTQVCQEAEKSPQIAKVYGGLCHSFPILVRTCGLCQAVAFSKAKEQSGESGRARAHGLLLDHVSELLKSDGTNAAGDALDVIREASALEYMMHTRRILTAWIYFKRFAVSILKVDSARAAEEGQDGK